MVFQAVSPKKVLGGRFLRRSRDQHIMDWTGVVLLLGGAYGFGLGCGGYRGPVETGASGGGLP